MLIVHMNKVKVTVLRAEKNTKIHVLLLNYIFLDKSRHTSST